MENDDATNEAWPWPNFEDRADVGEDEEGSKAGVGRLPPPDDNSLSYELLLSDQGPDGECYNRSSMRRLPGLTPLDTISIKSINARALAKTPLAGLPAENLEFTPINKFVTNMATLDTITKVPEKVQAKRSLITAMPASKGEKDAIKKRKVSRGRSNTGQWLPKKYCWCHVTVSGRRASKLGKFVEWDGKAEKKRVKSTKSAKKPKV